MNKKSKQNKRKEMAHKYLHLKVSNEQKKTFKKNVIMGLNTSGIKFY